MRVELRVGIFAVRGRYFNPRNADSIVPSGTKKGGALQETARITGTRSSPHRIEVASTVAMP